MDGNIRRENTLGKLTLTSATFFLSYFMQALYGFTDLIIIGRYGTLSSIIAVASGSQVMHLITVVAIGLAVGTSDAIRNFWQKSDKRTTEKVIGATLAFYGSIAVAVAVLFNFLTPVIASLLNVPDAALPSTKVYLHICFNGIPFIALANLSNSTYRGLGDSKSPMIILFISSLFNIFLTLYLVKYRGSGIYGAALGTVASQALNAVLCTIHINFFLKKKGMKVSYKYIRFDRKIIRPITEVGYPIAVHDAMIQLAFILIMMILNRRGLVDSAATGIVEKLMTMLLLVSSSVHSGVAVHAKEAFDDNDPEKAREYLYQGLLIAGLLAIIGNAVIQIFPSEIMGLFTIDSAAIMNGAKYLSGYSIGLIFASVHYVYTGYFNALGMSGISYVHNIISSVFLRIPGVYFMSILYPRNLYPVGIASASGAVFSAIICVCIYIYLVGAGKKKIRVKSVVPDRDKE